MLPKLSLLSNRDQTTIKFFYTNSDEELVVCVPPIILGMVSAGKYPQYLGGGGEKQIIWIKIGVCVE